MRARILISLLCLFSLWVEITIDPSTAFVRAKAPDSIGRLSVLNASAIKKVSSEGPCKNQHAPSTQGDASNMIQIDSSAHAACAAKFETFTIFVSSTALNAVFIDSYSNPTKLIFQRPPII